MNPETLNRLVRPFWLDNHMEQESVLFVQQDGHAAERQPPADPPPPDAPLLFKPTRILSVSNATLEQEYAEGRDWTCQGARLVLPPGSRIPFLRRSELRPQAAPPGAGIFPGRDGQSGVLFAEGGYFHLRQAAVTYEHAGPPWDGPRPGFQGELLPRAMGLLRSGGRMSLALFGDSISVGANASAHSGVPPYLPTWSDLVRLKLHDHFQIDVSYSNPSEGGRDSAWGLAEVRRRLAPARPDLVILAFGMNDGTAGLEAAAFQANIAAMMEIVRQSSPQAEFILVAPMLANPESTFDGLQPEYGAALQSLRGPGAAVVDMGSFHAALLRRKRYADLTGNHINHPNDFLSRCYAMAVLSALIDFESEGT